MPNRTTINKTHYKNNGSISNNAARMITMRKWTAIRREFTQGSLLHSTATLLGENESVTAETGTTLQL